MQEPEHYKLELSHVSNVLSDQELSFVEKRKSVEGFVRYFFDKLAVNKGAIGWVEQTPRNSCWASQILECFCGGHFIYIFRDPRDVVASLIPLWWGPRTLDEAIDYYKVRYHTWKKSYALIKKSGMENRIFLIRFEEMIESAGIILQPIFGVLGLKTIELSVSSEEANIGRWEKQFSKKQKGLVNELLRDELIEQGYV